MATTTSLPPPPSTDMDTDPNPYDWAQDAFLTLNDNDLTLSSDKWMPFSQPQSFPPSAFTNPISLLSESSVERYGQLTPPEELSPVEPQAHSTQLQREDSIPVDQLRAELSWPMDEQSATSEARVHGQQQQQQAAATAMKLEDDDGDEGEDEDETARQRASKRRRTSKNGSAKANTNPAPSPQTQTQTQTTTTPNPPAQKRKRGRPKANPQPVDGFPFEVSSARQTHLEKNRVAAHKCRQRKKHYIGGLEERAREFSAKNKLLRDNVGMLREEVLLLKNEVLRHAGCGFWAVDEYLARCAGDLVGMENPNASASRKPSQMDPSLVEFKRKIGRESSADSMPSPMLSTSLQGDDLEDYGGLELLRDFDDEEINE